MIVALVIFTTLITTTTAVTGLSVSIFGLVTDRSLLIDIGGGVYVSSTVGLMVTGVITLWYLIVTGG